MQYSVITGQEVVKRRLLEMVQHRRIPHALLISGQEGYGSLALAFAFAQHLFCVNPTDNGGCGNCPGCSKASKLIHPDLHPVFPVALSKTIRRSDQLMVEFREAFAENPYLTLNRWFEEIGAGNKQPVIAVDEASEIVRKHSYTSYEGGYKVVVIWHAETMNPQAANKLLKILEEPPDMTVFVLLAPQPQQLLSTILSRVQVIPCIACTDKEIADALVHQYDVFPDVAMETALLAGGNYAEALSILESREEDVSFLNNFQAFMRLALKFECVKALQWVDDCAIQGRERQKQFIQYALGVFRDSLMHNYGDKALIRVSGQERQFLEKFSPFVNRMNYERLVEEFNNNYFYLERNANPKILFLDLLLKTGELINLK